MATATGAEHRIGEERFTIRDVGWKGYQTLLDLVGDRLPRLTYSRGHVELSRPHLVHERFKCLIGQMVSTLTEELDLPCCSLGSATLNHEGSDCGLEPDSSYYFSGDLGWLRARLRIDFDIDPPPDLAFDVEITECSISRLGIYAKLGVPEVWRFDGTILVAFLLQPDGSFQPSLVSKALPSLALADLGRFLDDGLPSNDTDWRRGFRSWVRAVVVPARPGRADKPAGPPFPS